MGDNTNNRLIENSVKKMAGSSDINEVEPKKITIFEEAKNSMEDIFKYLAYEKKFEVGIFVNKVQTHLNKYNRILYSILTPLVYEMKDENIYDAENRLMDAYKYCIENNQEKRSAIYLKMYDHIELAYNQYSELHTTEEEIRTNTKPLIKEFDDGLKETIKFSKKEVEDKVNEKVEGVNAQLISIVAIFTGIAFVLFGGVNMSAQLIQEFTKLTQFYSVAAMLCLVGIVFISALFLFVFFMLKLLNKELWKNYKTHYLVCIGILFALMCYFIYQFNINLC